MKLKIDDKGAVVLQDGMPVYVHDDGSEVPFDGAKAFVKIKELNAESKDWRLKYEKTKQALEKVGDLDPEAARAALATVANLDAKKLIDAGEVEKVKAEITKAMQAKLEEKEKLVAEKDSMLVREMIGGRFARSKFIAEKLVPMPPDLWQAYFSGNFKIEDEKVIAYDRTGNKVFSRKVPGENAEFDEALQILVDNHPEKDRFYRGPAASGPGMQPGSGGYQNQGVDYSKLNPVERLNAARQAGKMK